MLFCGTNRRLTFSQITVFILEVVMKWKSLAIAVPLSLCLGAHTAFADPSVEFEEGAIITEGITDAVEAKLKKEDGLKTFSLQECGDADLARLCSLFPDMETLQITNSSKIKNLAPLAGLKNLVSLEVEGCEVADLSPVAGLTGLTALHMDAAMSEDFEELADALSESKAILLMVQLTLDDDNKVNGGYAYLVASQEIKNVNNIYLNCSKNIFLSLDKNKEWSGSLCEAEDWEKESEYENYASAKKRDKFEEDFAEYDYPFATETGSDDFDKTSRRIYGIHWSSDAGADEKEMDGLVMASVEFGLVATSEPEPEPEPEPLP